MAWGKLSLTENCDRARENAEQDQAYPTLNTPQKKYIFANAGMRVNNKTSPNLSNSHR